MFPDQQVADLVLRLLLYTGDRRALFEAEAARRGIAFEQLQAAAITGAVREFLDTAGDGGRVRAKR